MKSRHKIAAEADAAIVKRIRVEEIAIRSALWFLFACALLPLLLIALP